MNEHSAHEDHDATPHGDRHTLVEERVRVEPVAVTAERKMSVRSFIAGFVSALVAAALAIVVFLAVTDSDDDGEIDVDVPTIDVDIDG